MIIGSITNIGLVTSYRRILKENIKLKYPGVVTQKQARFTVGRSIVNHLLYMSQVVEKKEMIKIDVMSPQCVLKQKTRSRRASPLTRTLNTDAKLTQ